ncbi:MAG TPA: type VI secretion system tube protein Hcp [Caldimonas sp.]|nr:type VI secretion system tube protein Hcp [Caldimonas sp.]
MASSLNAFMQISNARGESKQGHYKDWIEIQAWEWEVEAETSWTKGGGASVGKPSPNKMSWEHYWDRSSATLLVYICTGASFENIQLDMCKTTGSGTPQTFFSIKMKDAFITKVNQSANEEGNVVQKVEMVFKEITIEYFQQGLDPKNPGALKQATKFYWDIPGGSSHA